MKVAEFKKENIQVDIHQIIPCLFLSLQNQTISKPHKPIFPEWFPEPDTKTISVWFLLRKKKWFLSIHSETMKKVRTSTLETGRGWDVHRRGFFSRNKLFVFGFNSKRQVITECRMCCFLQQHSMGTV